MRAHTHVRMLAAVTVAGAIAAPAASAKFDNVTYPPLDAHAVTSHSNDGSTEWPLVGVGIAGISLLGGGVVVSRRARRAPQVIPSTTDA